MCVISDGYCTDLSDTHKVACCPHKINIKMTYYQSIILFICVPWVMHKYSQYHHVHSDTFGMQMLPIYFIHNPKT